ncbi:hypothetical protein SORBI_3002G018133 [Sorghum bicolor]|uniref:Uncharacterized protein n=1 Tax=Sorghum bicolor TaxID=4558 RepID=A0A1W0W1Y5_SORBI|nr:hypothetical protein SORBI_3002G018133 [Sorghum bicolor]
MLCWLVKMVMHLLLKLQEAQKNLPLKKSIEQLTSILPDLEKKLEDLEQENPSPAMDEMLETIASRVTDGMPRAASFTSS